MIKNLSQRSSRNFLKSQTFGHLGCVLEDGRPYVVPVNYLYRDECIYIHSLPGQKIAAMTKNPQICLQTEEFAADGFEWQSVIAFGNFELVAAKKKKMEILSDFYKSFPHFTPVEAKFEDEDITGEMVVFRISIERLTGVAEKY